MHLILSCGRSCLPSTSACFVGHRIFWQADSGEAKRAVDAVKDLADALQGEEEKRGAPGTCEGVCCLERGAPLGREVL